MKYYFYAGIAVLKGSVTYFNGIITRDQIISDNTCFESIINKKADELGIDTDCVTLTSVAYLGDKE